MSCFHAVPCVYDRKNRKLIAFNKTLEDFFLQRMWRDNLSVVDCNEGRFEEIAIGCGHCIGCTLKESRSWVLRILAELYTQQYYVNQGEPLPWSFVTLTYDDEHLRYDEFGRPILHYDDLRKFLQRVKDTYDYYDLAENRQEGQKAPWRFHYSVGEYGEKKKRPHYHCLFVGLDFFELDRRLQRRDITPKIQRKFGEYPEKHVAVVSKNKYHYNTPLLSECWNKGFAVTTPGTVGAACYTVGYVDKKRLIKLKVGDYYEGLPPERAIFTQKIGRTFLEKNYEDIYRNQSIMLFDKHFPIPRYFDKRLEIIDPELFEKVRTRKLEYIKSKEFLEKNTPYHLEAAEAYLLARFNERIKPYENLTGYQIFGASYFHKTKSE